MLPSHSREAALHNDLPRRRLSERAVRRGPPGCREEDGGRRAGTPGARAAAPQCAHRRDTRAARRADVTETAASPASAGDLHTQRGQCDRGPCAGSRQVTACRRTPGFRDQASGSRRVPRAHRGPPSACMRWAELQGAPQPVLCDPGPQRDTEPRLQTSRLTPAGRAGRHSRPPAVHQGL